MSQGVSLLGVEAAAVEDVIAQGCNAPGLTRALAPVGPDLGGWMVEQINPRPEARARQVLIQGDAERDWLVIVSRQRRERGAVLIGPEGRHKRGLRDRASRRRADRGDDWGDCPAAD